MPPKPFTLTLGMVPDLKNLGGNARINPIRKNTVFQGEKIEWYTEIRAAYAGNLPTYKHLKLSVECIFKDKRKRDLDNATIALKALGDTLVNLKMIPDDNSAHLTWDLTITVDPKRAPRTILTCEEAKP